MLSRQFHIHSRGYTDPEKPWLRTPNPKFLDLRSPPRSTSGYSPPPCEVFLNSTKLTTGHTAYSPKSKKDKSKPTPKPYRLVPPFERAEIARTLELAEAQGGTAAKVVKVAELAGLGYPVKSQYDWLAKWLGVTRANGAARLDPEDPDTPSPYDAFRWIGGVYTLDVRAQREAQHQVLLAAHKATPGTKEWKRELAKPVNKRQGPMKRSELTTMLNRLAQETTLRRTGEIPLEKDGKPKALSGQCVRKWIDRLDLHRRIADWMTEARLEAASDIRTFYSQATMLHAAIRHPGAPDENIHKKLASNMDSLTCFIKRNDAGDWFYAPKGYDGKITTSAGGDMEGQFSVKSYLLLSTTGVVLATTSVLGDRGLPPGEIMKMKVPGWGRQSGDGRIWVCESTHPTKQFYDQLFGEMVLPVLERLAASMPPRPDGLPHALLFMCDGEREQIEALLSPEMKALFVALHTAVLKHHRSASSLYQYNDVARTHQIIHAAVKSGRYANFLDGTVWEWVQILFAAAVNDVQQRHPLYKPSKSLQDRLRVGVRVLQPILAAIDDGILRDGVQKAGFDITTDEAQLHLNDTILLGRLSGVSSMTPQELGKVWKNLEVLRAQAVLERWPRVLESSMDLLAIGDTPKQAAVRTAPGRVQPDDRVPHRQRTLILTLFDNTLFKTDLARRAEQKKAAAAEKKAAKVQASAQNALDKISERAARDAKKGRRKTSEGGQEGRGKESTGRQESSE
jgi:hypothetical protein